MPAFKIFIIIIIIVLLFSRCSDYGSYRCNYHN